MKISINSACFFLLTFSLSLSIAPIAIAIDKVRLLNPIRGHDKRAEYKDEVILRSLQVTEAEYGPYLFESIDLNMTPKRATVVLNEGEVINTYVGPKRELMDKMGLLIEVPVRQGLLSYRLLLIHKSALSKFSQVKTKEDLAQLNAGLHHDWVLTKIFKEKGMNVQTARNFEGLFQMLEHARFDYIPRGVYEIYDELNMRKSELSNVVVEPTLALYLPMLTFTYVSPKEPHLAKRIEKGLRKMISTGEITKILLKYYEEDIQRADFKNRRIINITTSESNSEDILINKGFWLKN